MDRRTLLGIAGTSAFLPIFGPARAASDGRLDAEITLVSRGEPVLAEGLLLDIPSSVESGYTVPVKVSPTGSLPSDAIEMVRLFAPGNPAIRITTVRFGPSAGRTVSFRIRLARSQTVTAVARTSAGRILRADRHVDVLVGGCGFDLDEPA